MAPVKDEDLLVEVVAPSVSTREVTREEAARRSSGRRTPPGIWPPMGPGALGLRRRTA